MIDNIIDIIKYGLPVISATVRLSLKTMSDKERQFSPKKEPSTKNTVQQNLVSDFPVWSDIIISGPKDKMVPNPKFKHTHAFDLPICQSINVPGRKYPQST